MNKQKRTRGSLLVELTLKDIDVSNTTAEDSLVNESVDTSSSANIVKVALRIVTDLRLEYEQYSYDPGVNNRTTSRSLLELKYTISIKDLDVVRNLTNLYLMYGIDAKPLEDFILSYKPHEIVKEHTNLLKLIREVRHLPPVERDTYAVHFENVKFAVGMVMQHRKYHYVCVIYKWDPICKADKQWQRQMGVENLKYSWDQPFYNVLVRDGTERYAAQENLEPFSYVKEINFHDEIGKYFSHFSEIHYIPNAEEELTFPFDGEIRRTFREKWKSHQ